MLAQAIASTNSVMPNSSTSGICVCLCSSLKPRRPSVIASFFALNRSITLALTPFWSGSSTLLMIL
jgi:hypothetical protein